MEEFKQWYDGNGFTFHVQDRIYYTQCGSAGAMTLFELLKKTTDVSTEDFRQRGMSMDFLAQSGFARVVSRSSFRIHRMPVQNERVEIITEEEKPEAVQLVQTYEFRGLDGTPLISGESAWMMIHPQTRRIIPTKDFTLRTPNTERRTHDCLPFGRISVPQERQQLAERTIGASCLDGNGHVDNAWYATFIADALPDGYARRTPRDFRINYSKELFLHDTLVLYAVFQDEQEKVSLVGKRRAGDGSEELSFESELYF